MSSNLKVFCMLRSVEALLSLSGAVIHLVAFTDPAEPTTYEVTILMVFLGFLGINIAEIYFMCSRKAFSVKREEIVPFIGFVLFIYASIMPMVNFENDPHIQSMTDAQEHQHPYFLYNCDQSLTALFNSLIFVMHSLFAIDIFYNSDGSFVTQDDARLYCFPLRIWKGIKRRLRKK